MSKIYNSPEVTLEFANYEMRTDDISLLEGRILTHIDATFSDAQQRKAQKDILRQMVWDWAIPYHVTGNGNQNGVPMSGATR